MSQVNSQLQTDVAANKSLTQQVASAVATAFTAFGAALKTMNDNIASLKQQLADAQAAGTPADPASLADLEADNTTLQGIVTTAQSAIAQLNPASAGGDGATTDPTGAASGTNSTGG